MKCVTFVTVAIVWFLCGSVCYLMLLYESWVHLYFTNKNKQLNITLEELDNKIFA